MDVDETIHVRLPSRLARRLRARVPAAGDRNEWLVAAIRQRLLSEAAVGLASRLEAIERSFGTWTDEDFPGLDSAEDIKRWRAALWTGTAFRRSNPRRRPGSGRS
ncbi:MAG: hypothetical protein EPO22_05415 [Dehalococcoidia bacterium]|nr:MAG: hypothetical protein EPO22_05415 [Dehalococcoidia bacterium]